jgi:ABC-2 type transport system permease protein
MLTILALKEWRMALRSRTPATILFSLLALLGIAYAGTRMQQTALQQERTAANAHFRAQWEQLEAGDPHSAAHFGTYIFKSPGTLSSFDKGLNDLSGYAMRVEAHVQHHMGTPPLRPADTYLRFGSLSMAGVLQLFFPLFIFFYCFNSYTQEQSAGTLRLLLLQGADKPAIVRSKTILHLAVINGMLLISFLIYLPALLLNNSLSGGELLRAGLLALCYTCYCSLFVLLGMTVSARARNARQSLLILAGIWLLWQVMTPRLSAAAGAALYPLPSQQALQEKIDKAIRMGINGDEPREARAARLQQELLNKYKVSDVRQLPVNFDALRMQANEDYAALVYERYAAVSDSIIRRQNNISRYAALLDPYLAIRSISMALCGTDYLHQQDFDKAARAYRNGFIRRLNEQLAYRGSASQAFYRDMPPFRYQAPGVLTVLRSQGWALLSLLLWLCLSVLLLNRSARHELYV